ncbi:respiratory selenite reductase catalytic subunit SrrA [Salisediminibacterium halotolerans]|uniref:respiratory selenite reductase catalytic subunit SrrA n=1 Tax=Salisediminibacterium halotolerans TaxID=517425 RepID=UPI000EADA6DB|nr:respiratory selenite reductase catalytic subunit SrrA [Salisediminibacterium halotolerans]RLJ81073.1 thiosulfate reductase/polysulfide reductase chain A [Actinophytocola xinjiangensis]RPE84118.1 thiosulfate reductase/polysulfide reductase chain A [Salisediminibacterium halotolerans]TWG38500.1 thiosulfate reductase/polysulfide reductase chain A [Salisediminibacterium halotolerans]GEL08668.1 dehydrogenase [Salisediminibacterium halotolerans]
MPKMKRRSFLKASAVTAAAASVPLKMSFADYKEAAEEEEGYKIPTTCNGCSSMCGVYVHVKNDRVWRVEGHPVHLKSRGRICARGHGMAADMYNKGRVQGPMKRNANDEFEPISWEQAYKEIGEKLTETIDEHGGNSFLWLEHGVRGQRYANPLLDKIGSSNYVTHYSTCFSSKTNAWAEMVGTTLNGDHENAKYMIFEGRNFAGAIIPHGMNQITKAKENGAKIVVIDPKHSEIAKIADDWIPIKPGTDLAFRLALAHVLITEEKYDKDFVNGYVENFAEFWRENKDKSPEWAEEITGIPAEKIREVAHDLAANAPEAFIEPGWHGLHCHYVNSTQTAQMGIVVNALLGNFYKRGGLMPSADPEFGTFEHDGWSEEEKGPRADGAGVAGEHYTVEASRGIAQTVPDMIEKGRIKAAFIYHFNPLRTAPDPEYQKKIKNADLVVSINIDWNETSVYTADYILPESYYLERTEVPQAVSGHISHDYPQISLRQQVTEPLHDTKPLREIMQGITTEMGMGELYDYSLDDEIEAMLEPTGLSAEELKEKGTVELQTNKVEASFPLCPSGNPNLATSTGKIEFSADKFRADGKAGIPTWIEPKVMPDPSADDEFRLIHGKQPYHSHHVTSNNPDLIKLTKKYNGTAMWMNTKKAQKLGINDGDIVTVSSDMTEKEIDVKVTELIHPDCVWISSAYGGFSDRLETAYNLGVNYNDFIPVMVEPYSGTTMSQEVIVKVAKGGVS